MKKHYLIGYKVFFSLLGFSALVTEIVALAMEGSWNAANFFSYFTVESNIIAMVVLLASAFFVFAKKKSARLDFFRGAATFYMIVTGIVFAALLSGLEGVRLTAVPWDNIVLHYIIPIAVAIDWILDPPAKRVAYNKALLWLVFPIAYLIYSLLRGATINWYPYPFLNPENGGYPQVLLTSLVIMIGGVVLAFIVSRIGWPAKKK